MQIFGIGICFAIMLGAFFQIGLHFFIDLNSALFVLGGATGFLVMKNNPSPAYYKFWTRCCLFWLAGDFGGLNRDYRKPVYGLG